MKFQMYINGAWCDASDGSTQDVVNPATGEVIGQLALASQADCDRAVDAAYAKRGEMERLSVFERAELCFRVADAIDKRQEELAKLLTSEHGKPYYSEALGEVASTATAFRDAGEQIKWLEDSILPLRSPNRKAFVFQKPIGVFLAITPWNFPIGTLATYYMPAALAAGCPFIWNPATTTAAVASLFMKCIDDADIPAGYINLVIGSGSKVGDALVVNPKVAGVGFTGSTEVGNTICSRAKAKHTSMELGGNGPCIVLKDADIELAARCLMNGSFGNAGQVCTSTERVLVDDSIADKLLEAIKAKMPDYRLGDPFDKNTTVGPMHKMDQVEIVKEHVADALAKGAKLICGGKVQDGAPNEHYYEPTVIDHVTRDSLLNTEETFGPVLPLVRFKDESEIDSIIRDCDYRLFCAIFTTDVNKALKMAEHYDFGAININAASSDWDTCFPAGGGGGSLSGHGRSGGKWSLYDMLEPRVVTVYQGE